MTTVQEEVAKYVKEQVHQHGDVLIAQPSRCEGLLRDKWPNAKSEVVALVESMKCQLPQRILSDPNTVLSCSARVRLTSELVEGRRLSPEVADWAVQTWCSAFGKAVEFRLTTGRLHEHQHVVDDRPVPRPYFRRLNPFIFFEMCFNSLILIRHRAFRFHVHRFWDLQN